MSLLSCKAQSIIKSLDGDGSCPPYDTNCYEKDVNNEFGKFVGTWKYINGNTELTFKLKKEILYQIYEDRSFQDLLVGEYQYIENGVVKVNTLSDFNDTNIKGYDHNISGGVFTHITPNYCIINSDNQEVKIKVSLSDPNNFDITGNVILRYVNEDGIEKLQICVQDNSVLADDENANIAIPDGYYQLIKQ
jgi:hypothetical protein